MVTSKTLPTRLAGAALRLCFCAMPKGCRGIIVAFVGLALIGTSEPPPQRTQSPNTDTTQTTNGKADATNSAIPERPVTSGPDYGCERGKENRHSDLCAQWKAADAALDAAQTTWWQFWLGIGGLILGATTMLAAIAAAWFARHAALETQKGASAALDAVNATREANAIAEKSAERQLRAYMKFEVMDGNVALGKPVMLRASMHNYGQTPANKHFITSAICIRPSTWNWESCPDAEKTIGEPSETIFHPGDKRFVHWIMNECLPPETFYAIKRGDVTIFARASIFYTTVFGEDCRTDISLEFSGEECFVLGVPRMAPQGHFAN